MSATKRTVSFAVVTAAAGLMLAAASNASFASGLHTRPTCNQSCQANKAKPPANIVRGPTKSWGAGGSPSTGGKGYQQR